MGALDVDRLGVHYAIGKVPYDERAESIRLLGTEVFPQLRELLAAAPARNDGADADEPAVPHGPVRSTHA